MKDLVRSRPVLGMATLLLVAALAISFAATGIRGIAVLSAWFRTIQHAN